MFHTGAGEHGPLGPVWAGDWFWHRVLSLCAQQSLNCPCLLLRPHRLLATTDLLCPSDHQAFSRLRASMYAVISSEISFLSFFYPAKAREPGLALMKEMMRLHIF